MTGFVIINESDRFFNTILIDHFSKGLLIAKLEQFRKSFGLDTCDTSQLPYR